MVTWMYLLRHGATRLNLEKPYRLQGLKSDDPLAEEGIRQSRLGAECLRGIPLRAVYSSPMLRAKQTAEIVAQSHGLSVTILPLLHEGSVGRWENMTWDEIKAQDPQAYARFMEDPSVHGYDGGDNMTQVFERVKPVFSELFRIHAGQHFAVMGHQIINRVFVASVLHLPLKEARQLKFVNGGVTIIRSEQGERERSEPTLISMNITRPAW